MLGEDKMKAQFRALNLKGRDHLGNLKVDGRIITTIY
jgi:hypothetical protein